MGLFFIADILGGNKIVLVGSLIQDQLTRGSNWPFAAALAVLLMVMNIPDDVSLQKHHSCEGFGGDILKNRTKLPNIYLAVIMIIMYLPLVFVVVFSFNESKLTAAWTGFSLKWILDPLA